MAGLTPAAGLGQDPQANAVAQNIDRTPIAVMPTAVFSLQTTTKEVEAGNPIAVTITRQESDGQPHDFQWSFDPPDLVENPPKVSIDDSVKNWSGKLDTRVNQPGEGSHMLHVSLVSVGETAVVDPATIDVIFVPAPTFTVRPPDGAVRRGEPVVFTIARNGGSGQKRVTYDVLQGDSTLQGTELVFEAGGPAQNISVSNYDPCGEPLNLQLVGVKGQTKATAAFARDLPDGCSPTPRPPPWEEIARAWWPWWPVALGCIFAVLSWMAFRPRKVPNGTNGHDQPRPPADLHSRFTVRMGASDFPKGEPQLRLPDIEKRFSVGLGEADWPTPMPLRETIDD
jgi:hypothetical protein